MGCSGRGMDGNLRSCGASGCMNRPCGGCSFQSSRAHTVVVVLAVVAADFAALAVAALHLKTVEVQGPANVAAAPAWLAATALLVAAVVSVACGACEACGMRCGRLWFLWLWCRWFWCGRVWCGRLCGRKLCRCRLCRGGCGSRACGNISGCGGGSCGGGCAFLAGCPQNPSACCSGCGVCNAGDGSANAPMQALVGLLPMQQNGKRSGNVGCRSVCIIDDGLRGHPVVLPMPRGAGGQCRHLGGVS
eukprot:s2863_g2.t1